MNHGKSFRHTYTTKDRNGGRVTKTARKWYGEFTVLLRRVKRVPLCTDKRASRQALDALCEALSKAQAHATVTPDNLPPVIRKPFYAALKAAGHRDAIAANAYSPLSEHPIDWPAVLLAKGATAKHANLVSKRANRRKPVLTKARKFWCIPWRKTCRNGVPCLNRPSHRMAPKRSKPR